MTEIADKYTLTKDGKGDVHTSSETAKIQYLSEGYALRETGAAVEVPVAPNYDALTVPQLRDQIVARNAGRPDDEQISSDGNKGDLVAALQLDDES